MRKLFFLLLFLWATDAYAYKAVYSEHTGRLDKVGVDSASDVSDDLCSSGQILKRGASSWACASDSTSAGGGSVNVSEDGVFVASADTLNFGTGLKASSGVLVSGDMATTTTPGIASFDTTHFTVGPFGGVFVKANSLTAGELAADSVSSSELNATGVESELEAVLDLQDQQGAVTDGQVPNNITIDLAAAATALAANGTNCSAGNYPLGVDESGNAESCTAAGAAGAGGWVDGGAFIQLETSADNVYVGASADAAKLGVTGDADEVQFRVEGNATQTNILTNFVNSSNQDAFTTYADGRVVMNGANQATGDLLWDSNNVSNLAFGDSSGDAWIFGGGTDFGGMVNIDGRADEVQSWIQGHSTQTNPISLWEKSDGSDILSVSIDRVMVSSTASLDATTASIFGLPSGAKALTARGQTYLKTSADSVSIFAGSGAAGGIAANQPVTIPIIQQKDFTLIEPDQIQTVSSDVMVMAVDSYNYPNGIKLTAARLAISSSASPRYNILSWTDPVGTTKVSMDRLIIDSGTELTHTSFNTADVAAGDYVVVSVDTTNVNWAKGTLWFYAKD